MSDESATSRRRRGLRRDDGPLPTPLLVDVERGRWRAGFLELEEFRSGIRSLLEFGAPVQREIDLEATQAPLAECLTGLVGPRSWGFSVEAGYWFFGVLEPQGPRAHCTIFREFRTDDIPTRVVFEALELLQRAGVERLKWCPYQPPKDSRPETLARCGRLFLANRRQLYCSPDHAKRAGWQAWSAKNPRRKG